MMRCCCRCARGQVIAVTVKLQVTQAAKNGRDPQQSHASDNQQTDVGSILLHRIIIPLRPPLGTFKSFLNW